MSTTYRFFFIDAFPELNPGYGTDILINRLKGVPGGEGGAKHSLPQYSHVPLVFFSQCAVNYLLIFSCFNWHIRGGHLSASSRLPTSVNQLSSFPIPPQNLLKYGCLSISPLEPNTMGPVPSSYWSYAMARGLLLAGRTGPVCDWSGRRERGGGTEQHLRSVSSYPAASSVSTSPLPEASSAYTGLIRLDCWPKELSRFVTIKYSKKYRHITADPTKP